MRLSQSCLARYVPQTPVSSEVRACPYILTVRKCVNTLLRVYVKAYSRLTVNSTSFRASMIIAFLNQKGGVGKTTLAVNVAVDLAGRGSRVLLVDADPQ